ncbi:MAG: metallophosphoesterase [Acidobacteria bacterium]|nr:metallophosphoesterase [Acidobacteriota bacterium]
MKKVLFRVFLFFGVLTFVALGCLGYAYFIEPHRLTIEETDLRIPHWSRKLDGFKVVAISDIHGGSNGVDEARLEELVKSANAQNPDLIVLLGDFVSQVGRGNSDLRMPVETIADMISGLRAKYGVYGVIGNHDWWYNEQKVTEALESRGIRVLENRIEEIKVNGEILSLWGIEDNWKHRTVPTAGTFDRISKKENIIALTHNPDSLLKAPGGISIMFAGHRHGGQIKFPIFGAYPWVNDGRFMEKEAVVDGKHVFVTTGVGVSGPQLRFLVPPEIAVVSLFSEQEGVSRGQ